MNKIEDHSISENIFDLKACYMSFRNIVKLYKLLEINDLEKDINVFACYQAKVKHFFICISSLPVFLVRLECDYEQVKRSLRHHYMY